MLERFFELLCCECATARGGEKGWCDQARHCLLPTANDVLTASSADYVSTQIGVPQAVAHLKSP
jgi:hypothetical protein